MATYPSARAALAGIAYAGAAAGDARPTAWEYPEQETAYAAGLPSGTPVGFSGVSAGRWSEIVTSISGTAFSLLAVVEASAINATNDRGVVCSLFKETASRLGMTIGIRTGLVQLLFYDGTGGAADANLNLSDADVLTGARYLVKGVCTGSFGEIRFYVRKAGSSAQTATPHSLTAVVAALTSCDYTIHNWGGAFVSEGAHGLTGAVSSVLLDRAVSDAEADAVDLGATDPLDDAGLFGDANVIDYFRPATGKTLGETADDATDFDSVSTVFLRGSGAYPTCGGL